MRNRNGFLTLQIMILGSIAVVLVSGFTLWAATMLRLSLRDQLRSQAFQTAQAGIEYYRWHLAHASEPTKSANWGDWLDDWIVGWLDRWNIPCLGQ